MLHFSRRGKSRIQDDNMWAVSFIDLLSLLLCYFVVFYNTTSKKEKSDYDEKLAQIKIELLENEIKKQKDITKTQREQQRSVAGQKAMLVQEIVDVLKDSPFSSSITQKSHTEEILIDLKGEHFFDSGEINPTPKGLFQARALMDLLYPFKDSITMIIQGQTDSKKLTKKTKQKLHIESNWELSALRASKILRLFIKRGFPHQNLRLEGQSSVTSGLRKFTLKIRPAL